MPHDFPHRLRERTTREAVPAPASAASTLVVANANTMFNVHKHGPYAAVEATGGFDNTLRKKDSLKALAKWLNASIFCVVNCVLYLLLAFVVVVPAQDMGFMIEDLLKDRWALKSNIPLWVGEWSPRAERPGFYEDMLKNDPSVKNTWWNHFISGFLRKYDLDWGYWPLNGDQWETSVGYIDKVNGVLNHDYSSARVPAQLESLMQIAGPKASRKIKVPLHGSHGRIVGTDGKRVKLACVNWFGASDVKFAVGGLNHQPLRRIATQIHQMGFNCVRLPYSVQLVVENPVVNATEFRKHNHDLYGRRALDVLDTTIAELSRLGIMTILNNHVSRAMWCCNIKDEDGLWATDKYPFELWIKSMVDLATRYHGDPFVVGMDIRNEIHDWKHKRFITYGKIGATPSTDYKLAIEAAATALHAANPDWLLFVGGMCFNFDLTMMDPAMGRGGVLPRMPDHSKLVWTAHFYPMSMWWVHAEAKLSSITHIIARSLLTLCALVLYSCVRWMGSLLAVGQHTPLHTFDVAGAAARWELHCVRVSALLAIFIGVGLAITPPFDWPIMERILFSMTCMFVCLLAPSLAHLQRAFRAAPAAGRQRVLAMSGGFMAVLAWLVLNLVGLIESLVYSEVGCKYVYEWRFRWTLSWLSYFGHSQLDPSPLQ